MFGRSIGKSGAGKYGVSILKKVPRERGLFMALLIDSAADCLAAMTRHKAIKPL